MAWNLTSSSYSNEPFADLKVTGYRHTIQNGGQDSASFRIAANNTGTPPFDRAENVTIKYGSDVVFRGFVDSCVPDSTGRAQSYSVALIGAFGKLARTPYQQSIAISSDPSEQEYALTSECVLGYDDDGDRLNASQILEDIMSYAAAPTGLSAGSLLSGVTITPPQMELVDVTCDAALRRVLAWFPDTVLYMNHSSGLVNVVRPASLSTETRASSGTGSGVVSIAPEQRKRWPVAGIKIVWKTTATRDGIEEITVTEDTAGTVSGMDAVVITVPLTGENIDTVSQECVTETMPRALDDFTAEQWVAFLLKKFPEFAAAEPEEGQIEMVSMRQTIDEDSKVGLGSIPEWDADGEDPELPYPAYPRILMAGAVPPWQAGISAAPTRLTVVLKPGADIADNPALYELFDRGAKKEREFYLDITGTDAETVVYRTVVAHEGGESPITGLAADYYAALNADAPAGSYTWVGVAPDFDLVPGNAITLTGTRPVTNGVIQRADVAVDGGSTTTTVTWGPNGVLSPTDLVELQRAGGRRSRLRNTSGSGRTSAAPEGRTIKGSAATPQKNTSKNTPARATGDFAIRQSGPTEVTIADGTLLSGQWTDLSTLTPQEPIFPIAVTGSPLTVAHGDKVWLGIDYSGATGGTVEGESSPLSVGDATIVGNVTVSYYNSYAVGGYLSPPFIASPTRPASSPGEYAYVELATIEIVDGVMSILNPKKGPITCQMWFMLDAAALSLTNTTP